MHIPLLHPALARLALVIALLSVAAMGSSTLLAQTTTPSTRPSSSDSAYIMGRVKNEGTNKYLGNARIQLEGTSLSTLSDQDGSYLLTVPAGSHTLVVSYVGLNTERVSVQVAPQQTLSQNIDLSSEVYTLDAINVTGLREENSLALQAQRYSPNPKTVVATNAFGNATQNPGDLLQRVSGVSIDFIAGEPSSVYIRGMDGNFSSLLIDGQTVASGASITRAYTITQWGTANLTQVELIKAPQPDQDANAIAGYINLVTKRAFDQPGRRISLSLGTNWTDRKLDKSPYRNVAGLDNVSVSYSDVFSIFGKKNNLGVTFDASELRTTLFQEEVVSAAGYNFSNGWLEPTSATPLPRAFTTGDYMAPNAQSNLGAGVEYKLTDDSYAFLKVFYNRRLLTQEAFRASFGKTNATRAEFAAGATTLDATLLPSDTSTAVANGFTSTNKYFNIGAMIGSDHKLFDKSATLSLRANTSYAHNENTIFGSASGTARGIGYRFDRRNQDENDISLTQTAGPSISNPASYTLGNISNTKPKRPDRLFGARADLIKHFATAVPTYAKIGVKYNFAPRETDNPVDFYTYAGPDGIPGTGDETMNNVPTRMISLPGTQLAIPFTDPPFTGRTNDPFGKRNQWVQTASDVYNTFASSLASNTKISETITAVYAMGNIDLGPLRVLAGLRAEQTEVESSAWVRNTTASWGGNNVAGTTGVGGTNMNPASIAANLERARRSFVSRRKDTSDYVNVFPGVHFVYEPFDGLITRASYNKSISRPPVGNLPPSLTENRENSTLSVGNPDLKPYYSDNFEISVEKFYEPVGKLGASVFLKEIKDYFRSFQTTLGPTGYEGDTQYAGFTLTQTRNIGRARIRGFELNFQQEFRSLPGVFSGLGAFANFTYTSALGDFGTVAVSNRLVMLSPRTGNAGISYVKHGLALRAMYNYRAQTYAGTIDVLDFYQKERKFIDLKAQYTISKNYDFYIDVSNLTNEPNNAQISKGGLLWAHLFPGTIYTAGINARF